MSDKQAVMLSEAKHLQQMAGDSSPAARNDLLLVIASRLGRIIELLERQAREERTVRPGHAFHYEADGRTYQDFTHFIRANPGLDVRQLRAAKQEWDMQRGITKNKGRRPRI